MQMMLDLETLSTHPRAVVTEIGVCLFDRDQEPYPQKALSWRPTVEHQLMRKRHVSWSTLVFWAQQDKKAQLQVFTEDIERSLVIKCLEGLSHVWVSNGCTAIWGNGATFDVVIIESLYRELGVEPPWTYRQIRDLRTLAYVKPQDKVVPSVPHSAAADAYAQALWAYRMLRS